MNLFTRVLARYSRDSANVQQVTFGPELDKLTLSTQELGPHLLTLSMATWGPPDLPRWFVLFISLNPAEIDPTKAEAYPQIAPPRTRNSLSLRSFQLSPQKDVTQKEKKHKL